MNTLTDEHLHTKMMGCWLGKAVGGTLGMPYEGVRDTLNLTFYEPVPTEMLPNDDLDLQVVYAFLLDRMDAPRVSRIELAQAWKHIGMSPDEYGIVKRNLGLGLLPPTTGSYDNPFTRGMGAAIRTELWACLAPGDPDLAVKYVYEDACMDHAGEGIHAATYLAALESLAFVESDRETLLDQAETFIPADSTLYAAIRDTRVWWSETGDWKQVQERLAERYLNDNFTDVVINLAYIVLGWLAGDDFGEAVCIAVNCGQDTDCTGATLGALLGILDPAGIDDRWLEPIGRDLVLSDCITGVDHPPSLDGFTDLVLDLRRRIAGRAPGVDERKQPTDHLAIQATLGFVDGELPAADAAPAMPDDAEDVAFAGASVTLETEEVGGGVALVRYTLNFEREQTANLMFSSAQSARVWWDGRCVIDREGGEFVPAFHRCLPRGSMAKLDVEAGSHEVVAAVSLPTDGKALQWVIGVCDNSDYVVGRDWLIDPFDRVG